MARWGYYGSWHAYVPVSVKITNAKKAAEKLRKKGIAIQPVKLSGRKIASSFWGKAWCDHMESFHDYENRLPRGRTYIRNGSVVHLDITKGLITAMVAGSETYMVEIKVNLLPRMDWERIKKQCVGQISSLLDLLKGKLSDGVMRVVTDRDHGLFPGPAEFKMNCSCPDYAEMCKHIAAVFYGVGARLDTRPELLFLLRGVDHTELATEGGVEAVIGRAVDHGDQLAGEDLSSIFGIELITSEDGATQDGESTPDGGKRRRKITTSKKAKPEKKSATKAKRQPTAKAAKTATSVKKTGKALKPSTADKRRKLTATAVTEEKEIKTTRRPAATKTSKNTPGTSKVRNAASEKGGDQEQSAAEYANNKTDEKEERSN